VGQRAGHHRRRLQDAADMKEEVSRRTFP
jgi:hypothetical protein